MPDTANRMLVTGGTVLFVGGFWILVHITADRLQLFNALPLVAPGSPWPLFSLARRLFWQVQPNNICDYFTGRRGAESA